ncbi:MAG: nuclear transport factor 2 family protein [Bryobacteraceae bacterium]
MTENIAVIKKIYHAFGRGDVQTILDSLTPDVEWCFDAPAVIPYSGARRGPSEVIPSGDQVVTVGTYSATVKASGKSLSCVWRISSHFVTARLPGT